MAGQQPIVESEQKSDLDISRRASVMAQNFDQTYKAAEAGDQSAQHFINELIHDWRRYNPEAPIRKIVDQMIDDLDRYDPKEGAAVRRAMIEGDGSITFQ